MATGLRIRPARIDELTQLGDLCFRSKAVWGYDAAFMDACRPELTLRPEDLAATGIAVAEGVNGIVGVVQVGAADDSEAVADLLKLFVEPDRQRKGAGRALFVWAMGAARASGARRLVIEADPGAAPFYRRMGAREAGFAPSGSIPGRVLPKLVLDLAEGPDR